MRYLAVWLVVGAGLAFWSLGVWLLHAFGIWSLTHVGALWNPAQMAGQTALPAWIAVWIPADLLGNIQVTAAAVLPWLQSLLAGVPLTTGWLDIAAWIVWALGAVALVFLGAGLHAVLWFAAKAARR
jgi:hypothetical protein